ERRCQHLVRWLRSLIPEHRKAVRIERMFRDVPRIVDVGRLVDVNRLDGGKAGVQRRQEQQEQDVASAHGCRSPFVVRARARFLHKSGTGTGSSHNFLLVPTPSSMLEYKTTDVIDRKFNRRLTDRRSWACVVWMEHERAIFEPDHRRTGLASLLAWLGLVRCRARVAAPARVPNGRRPRWCFPALV